MTATFRRVLTLSVQEVVWGLFGERLGVSMLLVVWSGRDTLVSAKQEKQPGIGRSNHVGNKDTGIHRAVVMRSYHYLFVL